MPQPASREARHIYSVSELTQGIKNLLEGEFGAVWITGEISNFKASAAGHFYFSLKDEQAQIGAVMFRGANRDIKFKIEDGLHVIVQGHVSVYAPRGQYQIVAEYVEPQGIGALQLAFEQLKQKLEAGGLFDPARKRPLPFLPRRIGIVTSPTGAVIQDMIHILTRRFPNIEILLSPVAVQGETAAGQIAAAIGALNDLGGIDVMIVARGGGSMEDLWSFNEEIVARAIAASRIPVVSAVGHETDFTIADFVADLRAPTPSAAAELIVPVKADLLHDVEEARYSLIRAISDRLEMMRLTLAELKGHLKSPRQIVEGQMIRLDHFREKLNWLLKNRLAFSQQRLASLGEKLTTLSPLAILERGYAVVTRSSRTQPLTDSAGLKKWDELSIRLARGQIAAAVVRKS